MMRMCVASGMALAPVARRGSRRRAGEALVRRQRSDPPDDQRADFGDRRQAPSNRKPPRPATLALAGAAETHAIRLSARGITRRKSDVCQFPPLRVEFAAAARGDLAVPRPKAAEAGHPLPAIGRIPAACAARICRLPLVQPADAGELPRAAGAGRLCRSRAASRRHRGSAFSSRTPTTLARRNGCARRGCRDRISALRS